MDPESAWWGGEPLLANDLIVSEIERGEDVQSEYLRQRLTDFRVRGKELCFQLRELTEWLATRVGPFQFRAPERADSLLRLTLEDVLGSRDNTYVWAANHKLFVFGRFASELMPWLAPHVPINAAPVVTVFREDLRVRNPFRRSEYDAILLDARRCGLDLSTALDMHCRNVCGAPTSARILPLDEKITARARSFLRSLTEREWDLGAEVRSTLPLWLRQATIAPLRCLDPGAWYEWHLVASMGAGHVLWIRAARFAASAPTAMSVAKERSYSREVDGGDVHLWLDPGYDRMLEGESSRPLDRSESTSSEDA